MILEKSPVNSVNTWLLLFLHLEQPDQTEYQRLLPYIVTIYTVFTSCLTRVQKRLHALLGDELYTIIRPVSYRYNVTSPSDIYRYIHEQNCKTNYIICSTSSNLK